MKIDEGEIRTFAFQTIRSNELTTLLNSWDYDSDPLKFIRDTERYLELMCIMFKNNLDAGLDEVCPSHVPPMLNFAEILNIFDDILYIQQDLVKQEILSAKKNADIINKAADIHLKVLQLSSFMVRSFTNYYPCDWGRFPLMDKLIAFLDYTFSAEYFIELTQLIMVLFQVSQGKFMNSSIQLLPLFFATLDHLEKENYDIQKISTSLRNFSEEKLPSVADHLFLNVFHGELKGLHIHQILLEEISHGKDQPFNTPLGIKKKLIDRFQLSTEYELYVNGRVSKLKLIGAIHLLNLLKHPDVFDELKIHIHLKSYLCREILLRELQKEKQEADLIELLEVNLDSKETLRPFGGGQVTDIIEALDRASAKGKNKINVLLASYSIECILLIYRGYQKREFGEFSNEVDSDMILSSITEEFSNKFFKLNQYGSFLELDLIKRFLFIYNQTPHTSELLKSSAKLACIRAIEFLVNFLEQRIDHLSANDILIEIIEVLTLLDSKFFDLEQFTMLEKIAEVSEFASILLRCSSLIHTCLQRQEIRESYDFHQVRLRLIEKLIRWHHLQCKALNEKGYYYSKDSVQGLFRAKSRYICLELSNLLSKERKDILEKIVSWISPDQILENLERISPSLKVNEPNAKLSAALFLEILLFLFHTHRICFARSKERLLSKENFKRALLYSVVISRLNPANFYFIMNCLSSMVDESAEVQQACYEIGFADVFIQHVGFTDSLFDHIAMSCSYELYKPPNDIPTLPSVSWQTNLAPINGTINFKSWTEILFPHKIDWQRVLEFISDLVEKAGKQINTRMRNISELIANKAKPDVIERANRVFTGEFQKCCFIIFQALTNCEGLEFNQQELDLKTFLPEFGKMAKEALEFFFSISLTLLRFEKDDADLCKERQSVVELTASFMNLRRVKPFVDEFIASFWQKHMIETIKKFDDSKLNTVGKVFSKLAKISEISPQFRETHRKDLFHTITIYLLKRKQPGQEADSELVFFDTLEEIEVVIWLMKLLSLVNSCGNSNISGNNSTVRGVEDRVRRQLNSNLKLVERFIVLITRQRISYVQERPDEMKYNSSFYEIVDRLARCLIYGPYFQKTPRGLLNQNQIDDLVDTFRRLVENFSKPDSDKDKVIQSIFERTVLHTVLFGLYSNFRRSAANPSEVNYPDHFKNEQYLRCQVTAGANILVYLLSQEKRTNFHEVVITEFLNLLFERRIISEVLEHFRVPEVFKYNTNVDEYFETLIAILDAQALVQKIDFSKMVQYKNRVFNNLIGDIAIICLQFLKTNVTPLLAKTRHRWIDSHLNDKKISTQEFVEKIRSILRARVELKPLYEFLKNIRLLEGDTDSKEIFCSWLGIVDTVYPDLMWHNFVIPELKTLAMTFKNLLTKEPDQVTQIDSKYFVNLGNNNPLEDFLYYVTVISGRFRNICYLENPPENPEFKDLIKNLRLNYLHLLRKVFAVYDQAEAKLKEQTQRTLFADPRLRANFKEYLSFKNIFGIVSDYLKSTREDKESFSHRNEVISGMEKIIFASIQKSSLVYALNGASHSYSEEVRMISLMMESFPQCRATFFEKIFLDPERVKMIHLDNLAEEFFHIVDILTRDPFDPKFSLDLSFSCNVRKTTVNPEAILFSTTKKSAFFLQHEEFGEAMRRYIVPDSEQPGQLARNPDCKLYAFELESIREVISVKFPLFGKTINLIIGLLEEITDKDKLFAWVGALTHTLMKNPLLLLEFSLMEYVLFEILSKNDFNLALNVLRAVLSKNSANFLVKYKNKFLRNDECARILMLEKIVDRIYKIATSEKPNDFGPLTDIIAMQLRLIDIIIREFNPWWEEETQLSSEALQHLFLATEKLIMNESIAPSVKKRILQDTLIFQKVWFQVFTRIALEDIYRLGLNRESEQKILYALKSAILNTKFYDHCRSYALERKLQPSENINVEMLDFDKVPMLDAADPEKQKLSNCLNFFSHFACQIELYKNQQSAALNVHPVRSLYSFFARITEDFKDGFNYMVDCSLAPQSTKSDLTLEKARKKLFEIIGCKDDEDEKKNSDRNRIFQFKKKLNRKSVEGANENMSIQLNALQAKSMDQLWLDVIKSEEFVRAVKDVQGEYRRFMERHGIQYFNKMLREKKYDHALFRKSIQPAFNKFVDGLNHLHKIAFYCFLDRETIYQFENETEMRMALHIKDRFAEVNFDSFYNMMKNLSLIIKAREEEEEKRLRRASYGGGYGGFFKLSKVPFLPANREMEEEKSQIERPTISTTPTKSTMTPEEELEEAEKLKKLEPLSPTRVATTELRAEKILALLRNEIKEDGLELKEEPPTSTITKVKVFSHIFSSTDVSEPAMFKFVLDYEPSFRPQTSFFQVYSNESLIKYTDQRKLDICEEYIDNLYKDKPHEAFDVFFNSLPFFNAITLEKVVLMLLAFPKWRTTEIEEYKEMLFEICVNPINEIRILDFAYVLAQLDQTDPAVRRFFEEYFGGDAKLDDFEERFDELMTRLFENVEFLAKINKQSSLFISDLSAVNLKIEEKYGRIPLKDALAKRFKIKVDDINVVILQLFAAVQSQKVKKSLVSIALETMINNKGYRATIIKEPKLSKYFRDMSHDVQFRDRIAKIIHDQSNEFAEDLSLLNFLLQNCGFIEVKINDLEECNTIVENTQEFFEVMHEPEEYGNTWQSALVEALKRTIQESTLRALNRFSIFEKNLITIIEKIIARVHDSREYSRKNLPVLKDILSDLDQLTSNQKLQKTYVCVVQILEILEKLLDKFGSDLILKQMFFDAYVSYGETNSLTDFIIYTYEMTNIKSMFSETLEDIELKMATKEEFELEEEKKLGQTKWNLSRMASKDKEMHLPQVKKTLTELMATGVLAIDEAIMRLSQTGRKIISSVFMTHYLSQNQAEDVDSINRAPWLFDLDTKRQVFKRVIQSDTLDDSEVHKIAFVIDRERILEHTMYNFDRLQTEIINRRLKIFIKFVGEEGVDAGGLTNEWVSLLEKELLDPRRGLFQICANQTSLQPSSYAVVVPSSQRYFRLAGRLIGYGLCNNLSIEIPFARPFLKQLAGHQTSVSDLNDIDPELFNSLRWMTENSIDNILAQDFAYEISAFGEYHTIEIGEGENQQEVTDYNKKTFVKKLAYSKLLKEIEEPLKEFRKGIFEFVPEKMLKIFLPSELDSIFAGKGEIDVNEMMQFAKVAPGLSDKMVKRFWMILQEFNQETLSTLLFFITGKSKVGIGGFKEHPISLEVGSDNFESLPVAHTCVSAIDLPNYPTKEILKSKLLIAIYECKGFGFA